MKKRIISLAVAAVMLFALAGCGTTPPKDNSNTSPGSQGNAPSNPTPDPTPGTPSPADEWPKGTITWYTGPAGGTNDTMTRAITKTLEKKLGVSIVVVNANTTINMDEMLKAPADGLAIGPLQLPDCFGYLNPQNSGFHPLEDFTFVCNIVSEMAAMAIHEDDARLKDVYSLKDLIDWCKAHPTENLLVGVGPVAATHDITIRLIQQETGVQNLKIINTEGGIAERKATFLGNHVDIYVGNVGDTSLLIEEGGRPIAQFGTERSSVLPDTPTAVECGINVVYGGHRGVTINANVDPDIAAKFAEAMDWLVQQPEFQADLALTGQELNYIPYSEYTDWMYAQDEQFRDLMPMFGWN